MAAKKTLLTADTLGETQQGRLLKPIEEPRDQIMNFRVSATFRRRFRQSALDHDLNLTELLEACHAAFVEAQGR